MSAPRTGVRAEVITSGPKHDTVEQIVTRLSFEPGIAAVKLVSDQRLWTRL
jgi:hypothetical protein